MYNAKYKMFGQAKEVPAALISALPLENCIKLKILITPMTSRLQDGCQ